jgi:hypothetical protein
MYAAIRQGKARTGVAEELAVRIKEGAIPIISDVPGFKAYYVIYAPDDTVNGDQHLRQLRGSRGVKQTRARVDRAEPWAPAVWASHGSRWPSDRSHIGVTCQPTAVLSVRGRCPELGAYPATRFSRMHLCPMNIATSSASRLRFARSILLPAFTALAAARLVRKMWVSTRSVSK